MNEIGKKIKQLRRDADLTQEQLGDLLGVAYQTVSKWETGISSPDLSMIAPITRFFKISADELFGLTEGADDARQRELREKWQSTYESGDIIDRYEISKQAVAEFPGNYEYIDWLADAEASYAIHHCKRNSEDQRSHFERAIHHYQTIIENCSDEVWKNDALYGIVMTLPEVGRREEAVQYAKMHPKSDKLLKWCLSGEEKERHLQKLIIQEMNDIVSDLEFGRFNLSSIQKAEQIIETLIDDGNYLWFHEALMHNYVWQAQCYARSGQNDAVIECLRKSYNHAVAFENVYAKAKSTPLPYTCKVFDKLVFDANEIDWSGTSTLTEDFQEYLSWKDFDNLRERNDFMALTKLKASHSRP